MSTLTFTVLSTTSSTRRLMHCVHFALYLVVLLVGVLDVVLALGFNLSETKFKPLLILFSAFSAKWCFSSNSFAFLSKFPTTFLLISVIRSSSSNWSRDSSLLLSRATWNDDEHADCDFLLENAMTQLRRKLKSTMMCNKRRKQPFPVKEVLSSY